MRSLHYTHFSSAVTQENGNLFILMMTVFSSLKNLYIIGEAGNTTKARQQGYMFYAEQMPVRKGEFC